MSNEQYRIVVGVDGSPSSKEALRWALWHAGLTGGAVTAVMAWDNPALYNWEIPGPEDFANTTGKALNQTIKDVVPAGSTIEVSEQVAPGHPARALLDAADEAGADLLVVGNRGHGGFTGALLGSVSQHCVHHANCPVVVVRESKK